ncbi:MAG: zinc metallopeptidase [Clostridia bacterium]|nr:zinc metallopeptidase [Clostridia bacterium]
MLYYDWTILLLIPGLILGLWAQSRVKSTYGKYSKVFTQRGLAAQDVAMMILNSQGAGNVTVTSTQGELTDHFDPRTDTLRLSQGVYGSSSVAAVGIAAHEAGHALQKQAGYALLNLRTVMVPTVNIGSRLAWPIFVVGMISSWRPLMYAGIGLFALAVLMSLITLPVEFDASRRAKTMLASSGYFTQEELLGVSKVLNAAALTYVASFLSALLSLLRLVLLAQRRRR